MRRFGGHRDHDERSITIAEQGPRVLAQHALVGDARQGDALVIYQACEHADDSPHRRHHVALRAAQRRQPGCGEARLQGAQIELSQRDVVNEVFGRATKPRGDASDVARGGALGRHETRLERAHVGEQSPEIIRLQWIDGHARLQTSLTSSGARG